MIGVFAWFVSITASSVSTAKSHLFPVDQRSNLDASAETSQREIRLHDQEEFFDVSLRFYSSSGCRFKQLPTTFCGRAALPRKQLSSLECSPLREAARRFSCCQWADRGHGSRRGSVRADPTRPGDLTRANRGKQRLPACIGPSGDGPCALEVDLRRATTERLGACNRLRRARPGPAGAPGERYSPAHRVGRAANLGLGLWEFDSV